MDVDPLGVEEVCSDDNVPAVWRAAGKLDRFMRAGQEPVGYCELRGTGVSCPVRLNVPASTATTRASGSAGSPAALDGSALTTLRGVDLRGALRM